MQEQVIATRRTHAPPPDTAPLLDRLALLAQPGAPLAAAPRPAPSDETLAGITAAARGERIWADWAGDGLAVAPYPPAAPTAALASAPTNGAAPAPEAAGLPVAPAQVVRVDLSRLDDLMHLVGELVITCVRLSNQFVQVGPLLPVSERRALQETSQLLERQLRDPRPAVRRAVIAALARMRHPAASQQIADALCDPDAQVRRGQRGA